MQASEVRSAKQAKKADQREEDAKRNANIAIGKLADALKKHAGGMTRKKLAAASGVSQSSKAFERAIYIMEDRGQIETCKVDQNGRPYDAVRLIEGWTMPLPDAAT